jgi:aryl-alcohol dehydrogenase-like predicted oxidoreductase
MAAVGLVREWGANRGDPAQISLAWLIAQKPWIVPIPGTTKMPHLLDNLGADGVRFTAAEVRELNTALARVPIHGARLSASLLTLSGVEAAPKQ